MAASRSARDGRDQATGRFKPGNAFWAARATSGPAPRFADGESLWAACVEYFEWVADNPLYVDQIITWQGMVTHVSVAKMRAMTIRDMCRFLGIAHSTWTNWRKDRPDLARTIEDVDAVVWIWKFEGAAAGLLNPNIIARELSLGDKIGLTGKDDKRAREPAQ